MFVLDPQGRCETCLSKATDAEIIRCEVCQFNFHALCNSDEGNSEEYIARKSHLNLHKQPSTKKNFMWKCNRCLTLSEENQAASVRELMSKLMERFVMLESQIKTQIKTQVTEEFEKLTVSQTEEFEKLSSSIATKEVPEPAPGVTTVWSDSNRVNQMIKSSLLVKADTDGNPVSAEKVKKVVMDHGIPVTKVVVSSTGDTFINMPDEKSRDKLHPLLQSEDNDVVLLKSKLPSISIMGVTEDLSRDEIKQGICNQNASIGMLVNEQKEEFEVIYKRPPPPGKDYHQVTIRVSPNVRKAISNLDNKIFLSQKLCNVDDSFHIKRCNNCQDFHHYASKCDGKPPVCGYCGEQHKSNDCLLKTSHSRTHKCINCQTAGLEKFEGHSTFYRHCPAYKIQQKKLESSIAYNYSN